MAVEEMEREVAREEGRREGLARVVVDEVVIWLVWGR
jgi:hypothetical protein